MAEKSHKKFRKKGPERNAKEPSTRDDSSNFVEMMKMMKLTPETHDPNLFNDQNLMSEIGKLFFTSMMKFTNLLSSHKQPEAQSQLNQQHTQLNQSKQHSNVKPSNKGSKSSKLDRDKSNDKGDQPYVNQHRDKVHKQSKLVKLNKPSKLDQSNKQHTNLQSNDQKLKVDKFQKLDKFTDQKSSVDRVTRVNKVDKVNKVDRVKSLKSHGKNDRKCLERVKLSEKGGVSDDFTLSTQRQQGDSDVLNAQDPTPNTSISHDPIVNDLIDYDLTGSLSSDQSKSLNLNIYKFIHHSLHPDHIVQQGKSHAKSYANGVVEGTIDANAVENGVKDVDEEMLMGCFGGNLELVKQLQGCDFGFVDQVGRSAIHYACSSGNLELVRFLLNNHVDFNRPDAKGWTPLFISVVKGHPHIVSLLLERKADLSLTLRHRCAPTRLTDAHSYPIHFAAIKANRPITSLLLSKSVDVNLRDSQGLTPLSYACYRGDAQYVAFLLDAGADPTICDVNGRNSYHSLALGGSVGLGKLLRDRVGLRDEPDGWSLRPSELSRIRGFRGLSELFEAECGVSEDEDSLYQLLSSSIASALGESNSDQILRCLVRLGPDVVRTLFDLTLKVEASGGVATADGKRNRTPGGVFFTLLKQMYLNNYITKEDYQYIRAAEKERVKCKNKRV